MFLTTKQLAELTDSKRKDKQISWLMEHGFRFVLSLSGKPKVLQAEAERIMLGSSNQKQQPDFTRINA